MTRAWEQAARNKPDRQVLSLHMVCDNVPLCLFKVALLAAAGSAAGVGPAYYAGVAAMSAHLFHHVRLSPRAPDPLLMTLHAFDAPCSDQTRADFAHLL